MAGIAFLRRLLMKQAMKKSKDASGIMSLNKNLVNDVETQVARWVDSAKKQGQDIDKMGEQEIKYIVELNKPKVHQGTTNERFDALGKYLEKRDTLFGPEKADVFDLTGKKIDTSQGIMGGKNVPEVTDVITDTVTKIKIMEPVAAMKEANLVVGRKGIYKNLTKEQSQKILKDTDDWIFQRDPDDLYDYNKKRPFRDDPDPEDFAHGGRTGYFTGALADTEQGKSMSPGTRADYTPGQGHRENVGRPPGGGDPGMTYTEPSKKSKLVAEPIDSGIKKIIKKKIDPYEKKQRDFLAKQKFQWGPFEKYKTLKPKWDRWDDGRQKTEFVSKPILETFLADFSIRYPDIKMTDEYGYIDTNKTKQVIDNAVLDGSLSIGDSLTLTRTLDTMGEGITGIDLDTKHFTASGTPEKNKYTVGSKYNVGDLDLGFTGNIQGEHFTKKGATFDYGDGTLTGGIKKDYDNDYTSSELDLNKTFDLNDLAKLNLKGNISNLRYDGENYTGSSLTPRLDLGSQVGSGNVSANIAKNIIEGGTPDLGVGFSYPFAGGEFQGGASDILSENPNALLGYDYTKGDPDSTDPYLEFKANWDPIEGNKSAFFGLKKKFAHGGRTGSGLNYLLGEDDQNTRVPYGEGSSQSDFNQFLKEREQRDKDEEKRKFKKDYEDWKKWQKTQGGTVDFAAEGGRIGFGLGGIDKARRLFLKLMGGAAAGTAAAGTGLFSLLKGGASKSVIKDLASVPIKAGADGMPLWFKPLVNKVIKEGEDVTKKFSTMDREIVHAAELPGSKTKVLVSQDITTGNVAVDIGYGKHGFSEGHLGQPVRLFYKAEEIIEPSITKNKEVINKAGKTEPEFWVDEAEFTGGHPENIKFEETISEKFGKHGSDFSEVEKFATGKVTKASKIGDVGKATPDSSWTPDDYASGGRVPLGGGGIAGMLGE